MVWVLAHTPTGADAARRDVVAREVLLETFVRLAVEIRRGHEKMHGSVDERGGGKGERHGKILVKVV